MTTDNVQLDAGSGGQIALTREVSHSGDNAHAQGVFLQGFTGSEGSWTIGDVALAEDTAHSTGDFGIQALAVRNDTLAALAGTDGDYAPLQVNATGALFVELAEIAGTAASVNNGTADAGTLRVTIASDSTGVVSIDDNAGSLTVDGTVTANLGATDNAVLDSIQTAVEVIDNAVHVDDAAFTLGTDSGMMMMGFAGTQSVNANDAGAIAIDTDGAVHIADGGNSITVDNAGTFATQVDGDALTALQLIDNIVHVDDAAYTLGTDSGVMMMGFAGTQTVDANDAGAISMETDGSIHIHDGGNTITVDNGGTFAVQSTLQTGANTIGEVTIGAATTAAGDLAKAEDVAHSTGDVGVMALGVRDTSPAAVSGTDGDYEPLHVSDDGGMWITPTPSHTGGYSAFSSIDLDETEEDVSTTACTVGGMYFWNATAAPLWVQLFNATAASVTVGTTPPDYNFPIPANADSDVAGVVIPIPTGGIGFGTALSVAVTTGSGTNSGAPAANAAGGFISYKN